MKMRRKIAETFSRAVVTLATLALFVSSVRAQVAVAPLRIDRAQFISSTGVPLSGGCVNFFATGTSTPQAIYADSGGVNQLQNPLQLDAAGEASVWMTNTGYDIVANAGVTNTLCSVALGTQLWKEINKNPFSIILSGSNYIVASGTSDPSGVAGMLAYRSDIPCFRGFTAVWDCFVTLTGTQTLTNKTLVNPIISSSTGAVLSSPNINGTIVTGPPATYLVMANDLVTGTTLNKLTKINPAGLAGFAILPLITDTGGITGIVVAGAGITGNATIQQNGSASCVFDNATTAGNYIQISPTIAGDCHDAGVGYPSSGQAIGRSLATNAAIGTNIIDLFGPEIRAANIIDYDAFTPITYAVAAPGPNHSVSIPIGGVQNSAVTGSIIEVETSFRDGAHTGAAPTYVLSLNASTILTLTLVDATDYDIKATIVLSSSSFARIEVIATASTPSLAGMTRTVFGSLIDGSAPTVIADSFATATTITGTVDYMHVRVRK